MQKKIVLPVILALALAAGGIAWKKRHENRAEPHILALQGNVDIRQVELAFNGSGRVAAVLVREGERVEPGQVVARLDTERLRLALTQAEAQVAAQRQLVARHLAGSRPEEIRQAQAQRDAAQATLADVEQLYRRQEELLARNFISHQQLDTTRFALDKARAQWQASEQSLRLVQLGPRKEDTAAVRANLTAMEAAAAVLQHDLSEGELRAPSAGIIQNRILEVGDMATPAKPVLTLALTEPIWVRTWLAENQLDRVPLGAKAEVFTDSQPDHPLKAWVGYVSPSAEFTPKAVETTETRSSLVYQARVFLCPSATQTLRLGMPATVRIPLDQAQGDGAACK